MRAHFHNRPTFPKVKKTQHFIEKWYHEEAENVRIRAGIEDVIELETIQIYQYKIYKKLINKSLITELHMKDGITCGHDEFAKVLA